MAKKTTKKAAKKASKKVAKSAAKKAVKKSAPKKAVKKVAPKKAAPKKVAPKKVAPKKSARKPNAAFMVALAPSDALAAVIGNKPAARTEIIKKIWDYIKANGLQDSVNKRMINADAKLKVVFDGKDQISMFELAKVVNNHVKK